jgi:hypothetical protein
LADAGGIEVEPRYKVLDVELVTIVGRLDGGALVRGDPVMFADDVNSLVGPEVEAFDEDEGPPATEKAGADVGVALGGGPGGRITRTDELPVVLVGNEVDELVSAVRVPSNELDSGIGNGDRGRSDMEPSEFELVDVLELRVGATLEVIGDEALSEGTVEPVLARPSDVELSIGNGVRGRSEIDPSDLYTEETLRLAVGVGTEVVKFEKAIPLVVLFDTEELGIGKGVRGRSEIEPSKLEVEEMFRVNEGVELGFGKGVRGRSEMESSEVNEMFKAGDDVELGIGNGVRGKSEMDPREVEIEDV